MRMVATANRVGRVVKERAEGGVVGKIAGKEGDRRVGRKGRKARDNRRKERRKAGSKERGGLPGRSCAAPTTIFEDNDGEKDRKDR
jgi:hypothetical protein